MPRTTGTYAITTTLGESVRAFVPQPLPPADPTLVPTCFVDLNRQAELALARLAGVSGLAPSVEWLLYSAIRKEALLTSQIEGTQATLTDLFDEEAGLKVSNTDDVEEVTNYLRAFRWVQRLKVSLIGQCCRFTSRNIHPSRSWMLETPLLRHDLK